MIPSAAPKLNGLDIVPTPVTYTPPPLMVTVEPLSADTWSERIEIGVATFATPAVTFTVGEVGVANCASGSISEEFNARMRPEATVTGVAWPGANDATYGSTPTVLDPTGPEPTSVGGVTKTGSA